MLGFLTWDLILFLGLDHVYTAPWYSALILALGASLVACTYTRQWPSVKVAQRWQFISKPERVLNNPVAESLPSARLQDLGRLLRDRHYQVFARSGALYAFKGLAGRYAPIAVHAALILTMAGTIVSSYGGWRGSVICPENGGEADTQARDRARCAHIPPFPSPSDFLVLNALQPDSPAALLPAGAKTVVHVNDFTIKYLGEADPTWPLQSSLQPPREGGGARRPSRD